MAIQVAHEGRQTGTNYQVFYKKPPTKCNRDNLLQIGVLPSDYREHFEAQFKLSTGTQKRLRFVLQTLHLANSYASYLDDQSNSIVMKVPI